jgi:hypothetical protein
MKKIIYFFTAISMVFMLQSCDIENIVPEKKIPFEITNYLEKHFPEHEVLQVISIIDDLTKTYEVTLNDFSKLFFNRKKEVIYIKSSSQLPDSVLPTALLNWVDSYFPHHFIIGWELKDNKQKIILDNGTEVEFSIAGDFIRIND